MHELRARYPHLGIIVGISAIVFVTVTFVYSSLASSEPALDARTYLAAGERLNDGFALYALRTPADYRISYSGAPLISPPLIAVLWRPLAALPSQTGLALWWIGEIFAIGVLLAWVLRDMRFGPAVAVYALAMPIGFELAVGNMNGYLAAAATIVWTRRDKWWAGAVVGVMASLKVLPVLLVVWIIGQRRWRSLGAFVLAFAVCLAVVGLWAGPAPISGYLNVAAHVSPSGGSVSSLTGVSDASLAILVVSAFFAILTRARSSWSFAIACVGMVVGSPALNINWLVLLLPAVVALTPTSATHTRSAWMRTSRDRG